MIISNRHKTGSQKEREKISLYIKNALLGEVFTTPKPGLVDLWDNGAHKDMNWITFQKSTEAITPYLTKMYEEGYRWTGGDETLEGLFLKIRKTGKMAEKEMYRSTGGVNTHKGMLLSMGVVCASLGYCKKTYFGHLKAYGEKTELLIIEEIFRIARLMTERVLKEELKQMEEKIPGTHGERLYFQYRERGIRGEVLDGFPVVRKNAYPKLMKLMKNKDKSICQSQVNLQVLLTIMNHLRDTNVLNRGGEEGLIWIQKESEEILKAGGAYSEEGLDRLIRMNQTCIVKNISSGGAADQLALTLFLWQAVNDREIPVYAPICIR